MMFSSDPMIPFARALADAADGKSATLRFIYEDGQSRDIDARPFVRPFVFPAIERELLEALTTRVTPSGRLLDVGCGAGRHTRWLLEQGFVVDAIDASPAVVDVARRLGVPVKLASVWELEPVVPYEGLLLLGNSIGMAGDLAYLPELLRRLATLAPLVVLDSADHGMEGETAHVRMEYEGEAGSWFDWLHASRGSMVRAAAQAGLAIEVLGHAGEPVFGAILWR